MQDILKLQGYDMYTAFGFVPSAGIDDLERFETSKEKPKVDWPDDVTEFDLSSPAFQPKEVTLVGVIHATSAAGYWAKYDALEAILKAPGELILEVVEIERSFKVFYKANPLYKRRTGIADTNNIVVELSLTFQVIGNADGDEPVSNGGFVEIINQDEDLVALVQAPGQYQVIEISGIMDDGSGVYTNSIIDNI